MSTTLCDTVASLERQLAAMQAELAALKAGCDDTTIAVGHNPERVTNAQVGVKDGWRLLSADEMAYRAQQSHYTDKHDIELWMGIGDQWGGKTSGASRQLTFRTRKPAGFFLPTPPAPAPVACDSATGSAVAKDLMDEVKVGDYVTCIQTYTHDKQTPYRMVSGSVRRVTKVIVRTPPSCIEVSGDDGEWYASRFRPATRAEIESFLLKEAADKGFVVLAKVLEIGQVPRNYQISSMKVEFPTDDHVTSVCVREERRKGQPFLSAVIAWGQRVPLSRLTLVKDELISITVDGATYHADFKTLGVVTFGCARLSVAQIRAAHRYVRDNPGTKDTGSNRKVEAVILGKGRFDLPLLEKLVAKLDAS